MRRIVCSISIAVLAIAIAAIAAAAADDVTEPATAARHRPRQAPLMASYPFPAEYAVAQPVRRPQRRGPHHAFWANITDATFSWDDFVGARWVTPIRDQGNCGSCFTFGSLAAVETQYRFVASNPLLAIDLAEQEVISCIGYATCDNGGTAEQVATYLKQTGVPDEQCVPYTAGTTGTEGDCTPCADVDARRHFVDDWDYSFLPPTEEAIKTALLTGPVVANMQVYTDFDDYPVYGGGNGPVYQRNTSDANNLAGGWHIIAIVGWDDTTSPPSWIIKNSWGTDWGYQGYAKVARNQQDDCTNFFTDGVCFATHITTFMVTEAEVFPNGRDGGTGFDSGLGGDAAPSRPDAARSDSARTDNRQTDTRRIDGNRADATSAADRAGASDAEAVLDAGSSGDDGNDDGAPGSCECAVHGGSADFGCLVGLVALWGMRRRQHG